MNKTGFLVPRSTKSGGDSRYASEGLGQKVTEPPVNMSSTLFSPDLIIAFSQQLQGCFQCVLIFAFIECFFWKKANTNISFFFCTIYISKSQVFLHQNLTTNGLHWFSSHTQVRITNISGPGRLCRGVFSTSVFLFPALNGYLFGNFPEPDMCVGESVSWHLFGMGNEIDIHSIYFYGNTFISRGHRTDVINLFPATFLTTEMIAENPGKWMITCQVSDHLQAGMLGQYNVANCKSDIFYPEMKGQQRRYFIAAEKILWDYAPQGYNKFSGLPLNASGSDSDLYFTQGDNRIGGKYWKVRYTEYVDATFTKRKRLSAAEAHLGILGPVIKAEVGDTLLVTFANKADKVYSILPHGVIYDKASDAAPNLDGFVKPGAHVKPGETFTYKWTVPESVSPTAGDPPCLTYLYFSAVDPIKDTSSGLVGPLLVCKKGVLNADGTQKGIDKEFYLLFTVFDENLSRYFDENIQKFIWHPFSIDKEDKEFVKSNRMHAVNGYMYGNQPGLNMCKKDRVSWHLIGLGTDTDMHGIVFQGNTIHLRGTHRDSLALFPHMATTAFMQPDHAGIFKVFCATMHHLPRGMGQIYEVNSCDNRDPSEQPHGMIRTFYIAAEEVEWDYAPNKNWEFEKQHLDARGERHGDIFMNRTENWIGSQYKKVVYREYTDGEFVEIKARPPREEHLELLGPMIHAEVGDTILIIFKNKASRPYSISAQGVEEMDSGKQFQVPMTKPGEVKTYRWNIPKRSGPGPSDPNCIPWVYYSTVNFVKDTYSGLMGPLITCRKGVLNEKGRRSDIDYEFALLFLVFNENESWYLDDNIKKYLNKDPRDFKRTDDFEESNRMHAINGKIFGNLHGLIMNEDTMTNWYLLGLGSEVDIHTIHYHAESFLFKTTGFLTPPHLLEGHLTQPRCHLTNDLARSSSISLARIWVQWELRQPWSSFSSLDSSF
ncbi:hephaestin-like protein 1 isoform X1 [Papio anubis]|uniref:hephaestin-like protein 1 isoform X1 n=1 Tax=Papio anubis TaxID=9555 RepID=UPI0012AD9EF7|nr:hephaestin-like protein 1 isoform X1 [Papio anubis]